jgi:SnoaL-like domain
MNAGVSMGFSERLVALEEIKRLKARYFRCVDSKDWGGLAQTFAPGIQFDRTFAAVVKNPWTGAWHPPLPSEELIVVGRDAVVAMVRRAVEHLHTVHHGHMPEIDILTETTAHGIWAMEDVLRDQQHHLVLQGSGHYHDTYERNQGGWVIKTCRLTRLSLHRPGA